MADQLCLFGGVVAERKARPAEFWAVYESARLNATPAVWGVGTSRDEAKREAVRWLSVFPEYGITDETGLACAMIYGDLLCGPCTPALQAAVKVYGGEVAFVMLPDGRIDILQERTKQP